MLLKSKNSKKVKKVEKLTKIREKLKQLKKLEKSEKLDKGCKKLTLFLNIAIYPYDILGIYSHYQKFQIKSNTTIEKF